MGVIRLYESTPLVPGLYGVTWQSVQHTSLYEKQNQKKKKTKQNKTKQSKTKNKNTPPLKTNKNKTVHSVQRNGKLLQAEKSVVAYLSRRGRCCWPCLLTKHNGTDASRNMSGFMTFYSFLFFNFLPCSLFLRECVRGGIKFVQIEKDMITCLEHDET